MALAFDAPALSPSFVARPDQLTALLNAAMSVPSGRGQTVLLSGEAGVGKSRLAREFTDQVQRDGWLVVEGSSFERDRILPYAPMRDALQMVLATVPPAEVERCLAPA